MTITINIIAGHYLASAQATREHTRIGSPADLHKALDHFNTAEDALQGMDPHTCTTLQPLRKAAARGDYATAQAHYATITA